MNILSWFKSKEREKPTPQKRPRRKMGVEVPILPGRVSIPDDDFSNTVMSIDGLTRLVNPSFRREIIPLLRDLYKVNPDMSIALQDTFKLANSGHSISFPNNSDQETKAMIEHLAKASKRWGKYNAGMDGVINKMFVQLLISGAISIESVPNRYLDGISSVVFIKPEEIYFRRNNDGSYDPYQKNPATFLDKRGEFIKLNPETYMYAGIFNDTDEPYGIPPFIAVLDSIKEQHDMRENVKNIMETMGLVGFLEAKLEKPLKRASESDITYASRLKSILQRTKKNLSNGMRDGIVVGYKDDHEFKLNSTTKDMGNLDKLWTMNQQSVANGLGVNPSLIGVPTAVGEGANGVLLSKMISQLTNIQMVVSGVLENLYLLELRLAGFNCKGIRVKFSSSTITDEVKIQQGLEYKIRNLTTLYNQGIISQWDFARAMGYDSPDEEEPRIPLVQSDDVGSDEDQQKKQKREADKDTSDRKTRDKSKEVPKRKDHDSKPRSN